MRLLFLFGHRLIICLFYLIFNPSQVYVYILFSCHSILSCDLICACALDVVKRRFYYWWRIADGFVLVSENLIHISDRIRLVLQCQKFRLCIPSLSQLLNVTQIFDLSSLSLLFFKHLIQFFPVYTSFCLFLSLLSCSRFDRFSNLV
jgi:hypothetical protein